MSVVVTGLKGFVGRHLLNQQNVVGLDDAAGSTVDLLDVPAIVEAVARLKPTSVLHMAAQSAVPESFRDPAPTYQANFIGTENLLKALKDSGFRGRFLYVSSAEVYGSVTEHQLPVQEETSVAPLNPYAVSKRAAEMLCDYYWRVEGMDVMVARPFNHIGPGQSTRFAIADFAKTIIEIKLGLKPPTLQVGDLDVTRDFTDVRDVVQAYLLLFRKGLAGQTYNVCSGREQHMATAVQTLAALAEVQVSVQVDKARLRKSGQRRSCGNSEKLHQQTGWIPQIAWEQSLQDILEDWKTQLT